MPIVIKKRVSLEFLGEDYKDAYLTFKSIPVKEYEQIQEKAKGFEKDEAGSITFILDLLKEHFLEGEFPESGKLEAVKAEDLDDLDPVSVIECFKVFTGEHPDPKVGMPSTSTSQTAETPQQSS